MPSKQTYKGYQITVEKDAPRKRSARAARAVGTTGQLADVTIGDQRIDCTRTPDGKYSSSHLPYTTYNSALELAKAIVEHSPDFPTGAQKTAVKPAKKKAKRAAAKKKKTASKRKSTKKTKAAAKRKHK